MKTEKMSKKEYSVTVYKMLLETVFGICETGNDRYLDVRTGRRLNHQQVLDIISKY